MAEKRNLLADVIDRHRPVASGIGGSSEKPVAVYSFVRCACGDTEKAFTEDLTGGPIDAENNTKRQAERMHAWHVEQEVELFLRGQVEAVTERLRPQTVASSATDIVRQVLRETTREVTGR